MFERLISNLLDLAKVEAIVLFDPEGTALFQRLPAGTPLLPLEALGRRVSTLFGAADASLDACTEVVCKYTGRTLVLRRIAGGILALFCAENVNLAGVRMTLNLGTKSLTADQLPSSLSAVPPAVPPAAAVRVVAASPSAMPTPTPALTPATPTDAAPKATPRMRVYRGVVYSD